MKDDICKSLLIPNPTVIHLPTERVNILYDVVTCPVGDFSSLNWCVENLRAKQKEAMKVIIYGRNVRSVSAIFKHFSYALEEEQFLDGEIAFNNRLIAMFHRSTDEESKSRVLNEFKKPDSQVRLVVATSSFEMGLDFPDVSIIINFGMPRSLESFVQQSGRGGRGISQAYSLVVYQGAAGCKSAASNAMRKYATASSTCRRAILRNHFQLELSSEKDVLFDVTAKSPVGCRCCDICRKSCKCENCLTPPWDCGESKKSDPVDVEMEADDKQWSSEKLELLVTSLDEYRSEVYELEYGSNSLVGGCWESLVDRIGMSLPYIESIEDLMAETGLNECALAEELFSLIDDARSK